LLRRRKIASVIQSIAFARWARRAFPNLIYFNEADRGGHFAMGEYPELFAAELRAAFKSLQ
jgi:pimeloyl-ACP methyl ester carboxylesterase